MNTVLFKAIVFFFLALTPLITTAQDHSLSSLFNSYGVSGSITIYDLKANRWHYSDPADSKLPMQPASTFKVINLLIGLESGTISDENSIIPWPGKTDTLKYGYRPEIYKDISIKEAFEVSAGWAFIEMAKKIPRKTYLDYLKKSKYGNLDLSEVGADFWNFGPMKISPINQVEFLTKLYKNQTPFSTRSTNILKRVMVTQKTQQLTLRSKTGWTRTAGKDIGWWVGYIEVEDNVYFFATRITKPLEKVNANFGNLRKEITKAAMGKLFGVEL